MPKYGWCDLCGTKLLLEQLVKKEHTDDYYECEDCRYDANFRDDIDIE